MCSNAVFSENFNVRRIIIIFLLKILAKGIALRMSGIFRLHQIKERGMTGAFIKAVRRRIILIIAAV